MNIEEQLDIYNPAEFYASVGLLTVLSLQHPGTDIRSQFAISGYHGENNTTFVASSDATLSVEKVIEDLTTTEVEIDRSANVCKNPDENPSLISPVILKSIGWSITIDWWLDELRWKASGLKFWSGNSSPADMLRSFIKHRTEGGTVFGFDTRISRDALAVGYSKKDTQEKAALYPRTELLCAIGLQQYRPRNYTYYAWQQPISLTITHAAATQEIPGLQQSRFEFEVRKIGQGAKEVVVGGTFPAAAGLPLRRLA